MAVPNPEAKEEEKKESLIDNTGSFLLNIGFTGEISSGKSTILNAILGDDVG